MQTRKNLTFATRIDIPAPERDGLVDLLNARLDQDSADLFTEVSRTIDKHLWFVEAHLQGR